MPVEVQILMNSGCEHGPKTAALVREVLREQAPDATVETVIVDTAEEAELFDFPGSPTVRVDGMDIDPGRLDHVGVG